LNEKCTSNEVFGEIKGHPFILKKIDFNDTQLDLILTSGTTIVIRYTPSYIESHSEP
jgi:hypothetical protein